MDLSRLQSSRDAIESFAVLRFDDRDVARYEEEQAEFLRDYAEYLKQQRQIERERARRIVLELFVANGGSVPATDIDVRLYIPDPFEVVGSDILTDEPSPKEPAIPKRRSLFSDFAAGLDVYPRVASFRDFDIGKFARQPPPLRMYPVSVSSGPTVTMCPVTS